MRILHRLRFKVVGGDIALSGEHFEPETLEEYAEYLRRKYPDAAVIHIEHIETVEVYDSESGTASDSLIILCLNDAH